MTLAPDEAYVLLRRAELAMLGRAAVWTAVAVCWLLAISGLWLDLEDASRSCRSRYLPHQPVACWAHDRNPAARATPIERTLP